MKTYFVAAKGTSKDGTLKHISGLFDAKAVKTRDVWKELIEQAVRTLTKCVPTDDMGDYGGTGAYSDSEVCELLLEDIIPEIESLKPTEEDSCRCHCHDGCDSSKPCEYSSSIRQCQHCRK